MFFALICTEGAFDVDLAGTLLWRDEVERHLARSVDEALTALCSRQADLVVVDRDLPRAAQLVSQIRRDPKLRHVSVVVIARADFEAIEVELLEAGANAVLRLPADAEWDDRLARLVTVPARREVRLPVQLELEAKTGAGVQVARATALNLSVKGLLMETDLDLHVGDDLDLRFQLPGSDISISACGQVVRHAGRHRYGVAFYGIEGEGPELVQRYVGQIEPSGSSQL